MQNDIKTNHVGEIIKDKWSDKPFYEQNKSNSQSQKSYGRKLHKSADQPSQLASWWNEEFRKKSNGLPNEIDENEKIAASKGVKNKYWKPKNDKS